jgi:membrane-bound lytic murein transglycosylase B
MGQPSRPPCRGLLAASLLLATAFLLVSGSPGRAQIDELFHKFIHGEGGGSGSAPQAPTGSVPWSGQSGASGDPLMTAEAILQAAAHFSTCVAQTWPEAARRGVSQQSFASATAHLEPDLRIMDLLDAQPEFNKTVWDYLDQLVSDAHIEGGRDVLAKYGAIFQAAERAYGVDRFIVAAIWGIESNYGAAIGDRPVIQSTATLACIGRRQAYFREEFLSALEILNHGDIQPDHLKGSWAGAFGPTQFMPTAFKRYAVDFDGDGRRDVVDSLADVIASTANNLHIDGWIPGQAWGYEVVIPRDFDFRLADRSRQYAIADWERLGIRRADARPFPRSGDRAYLLLPAGARGPAFLMLNNFRVIMRYNPAEAYALAIGHLADRLRGEGPIIQPWPRDERALSAQERYELQQRLETRGFNVGDPDGRLGAKTRAAIRDFQAQAGLLPDGYASADVLDRLRGR